MFCMHVKSLKMECLITVRTVTKNQAAYEMPLDYIDCEIIDKFKGDYIIKTPLWAIQHCLSLPNPSKKTYSFKKSNPLGLSRAADRAFVICGFINPHCSQGLINTTRTELPCDPSYTLFCRTGTKNKFQLSNQKIQ